VKFWCIDSFNRSLELCYPHFPTEQDFIHSVLSSGDICSYTQKGDLYLLGQFAQEWSRLQAGGLLLPDLVEFYQWLHTALGRLELSGGNSCCGSCCVHNTCTELCSSENILAHQVTKEHARVLPIGRVVELAAQRYSKEEREHTQSLYNRVKGRLLRLKMGAITIMHTFTLVQMVTTSMWGLVVAPLAQGYVQLWGRASSTPFQMILHYSTSSLVSWWQV